MFNLVPSFPLIFDHSMDFTSFFSGVFFAFTSCSVFLTLALVRGCL